MHIHVLLRSIHVPYWSGIDYLTTYTCSLTVEPMSPAHQPCSSAYVQGEVDSSILQIGCCCYEYYGSTYQEFACLLILCNMHIIVSAYTRRWVRADLIVHISKLVN